MIKKIKEKKSLVIFFILLFVFALPFLSKINGNLDEESEQRIVLNNFSAYAKFFNNNEIFYSLINEKGIVPITYSIESDHGVACYYPLIPIILNNKLFPTTVSNIWHLYIFIIFFISVIYFYKTIKLLFNNEKIAILMTLLYYLSPRIFIDSMHNNKDLTLMSLLIISIYYLIKIIRKSNNKDMIKFAIVAAFLSNTKIIGFFFTGILGLEYIIYLLINRKFTKEKAVDICFIFLLYILIFFLITPVIWTAGINIVDYFKYCLKNSTSLNRWGGKILFEGKYYDLFYFDKTGVRLPWYYIPKNIILTLPITILLLFIISFIAIIIEFIKKITKKKKIIQTDYHFVSLLIMFTIPLLVCIFSDMNVYNVWRHFYFLYGLILLICSYIVNLLWYKKYKNFLVVLIIFSLLLSFYNLTKYGVKNAAYYNILAGNKDISKKYELDYYNITTKESLKEFYSLVTKKNNQVAKVYLFPFGNDIAKIMFEETINRSYYLLDRIILVDSDELDGLIKSNTKVYLVENHVYSFDDLSSYKLIYNYKYKNSSITKYYLINKDNYKDVLKRDKKYRRDEDEL